MGVPPVVPALPGNVELLGEDYPWLVRPRDDVEAYASALAELAGDPERRAALGASLRERARSEFSVQAMADAHVAIYDRLLEDRPAPQEPPRPARLEATALPPREPEGTPLVSVVVPCFNHGRYLPECIESIRAQTWTEVEIFVVDDASTEPETHVVLDELEAAGDVRVLRRDVNGRAELGAQHGDRARTGALRAPGRRRQRPLPGRDRAPRRPAPGRSAGGRLRLSEHAVLRHAPRLLRGSPVQPVLAHVGQLRGHLLAAGRLDLRRRLPLRREHRRHRGLGSGAPAGGARHRRGAVGRPGPAVPQDGAQPLGQGRHRWGGVPDAAARAPCGPVRGCGSDQARMGAGAERDRAGAGRRGRGPARRAEPARRGAGGGARRGPRDGARGRAAAGAGTAHAGDERHGRGAAGAPRAARAARAHVRRRRRPRRDRPRRRGRRRPLRPAGAGRQPRPTAPRRTPSRSARPTASRCCPRSCDSTRAIPSARSCASCRAGA